MIYLDNAATTKPLPEVIDVINHYLTEDWYNPSALYGGAVKVQNDLQEARKVIADSIGAKPEEIIFTSGGSESNALAIKGFESAYYTTFFTSETEHNSVLSTLETSRDGFYSIVQPNSLIHEIKKHGSDHFGELLVTVQVANNETGEIQNIREIAKVVHQYNGILHVDAVQAYPYMFINVEEWDIDMMSISGHKFGCPKGIGFLYKSGGIKINPIVGGSQNYGLRGGTENIPYIMGMAKAVEMLQKNRWDKAEHILSLQRSLEAYLLLDFNCKINGGDYRLPNITSVTFNETVDAESLLYYLDTVGIYVSTGAACNAHSKEPSHVLKAIGLTDEEASRTIRISLNEDNNIMDIIVLVDEIRKYIEINSTER